MSVAMTNCGAAGWVTDRRGYRYDRRDPASGLPWPPMPALFHVSRPRRRRRRASPASGPTPAWSIATSRARACRCTRTRTRPPSISRWSRCRSACPRPSSSAGRNAATSRGGSRSATAISSSGAGRRGSPITASSRSPRRASDGRPPPHQPDAAQGLLSGGRTMPLQNRVTPFGDIVAIAERGTIMGNRGIIHDPATRTLLGRRWASKAWIICLCDYKGVRRRVMGGGAGPSFSSSTRPPRWPRGIGPASTAAGGTPRLSARRGPAAMAARRCARRGNRCGAP